MARSVRQCREATRPRTRRIVASSWSTAASHVEQITMTTLRLVLAAAACVGLAGCATTPPEEDPVVQKLTELDGRLLRIERVLANQSLLDLSQRLEAAQTEARMLRGVLDEVQHQVQQQQTQQRDMYSDVDRRLAALEGGGARAAVNTAASSDLPVPQGDDRANYQAAFDLLK